MRRLAKKILRGNLLDLGSGKLLYYPDGAAGSGYIVNTHQRNALEGLFALRLWFPVAAFAFPFGFFCAWERQASGPAFNTINLGAALWGFYFLVLLLFIQRFKSVLLASFEQRDPAFWDEDIDRFAALSEVESEGWIQFLSRLAALIFSGAMIGIVLSTGMVQLFLK